MKKLDFSKVAREAQDAALPKESVQREYLLGVLHLRAFMRGAHAAQARTQPLVESDLDASWFKARARRSETQRAQLESLDQMLGYLQKQTRVAETKRDEATKDKSVEESKKPTDKTKG